MAVLMEKMINNPIWGYPIFIYIYMSIVIAFFPLVVFWAGNVLAVLKCKPS